MSNVDIQDSVKALGATVNRLRDAVGHAGDQQATLAEQVIESNRRASRDRKMMRILTGLMLFKLVTLVFLVFVIVRLDATNATIKDCTTPSGECAKRGAAQTAVFLNSAALRGERERLITEVPIAEAKGDVVGLDLRRSRLDQLDKAIADNDQKLKDINAGTSK